MPAHISRDDFNTLQMAFDRAVRLFVKTPNATPDSILSMYRELVRGRELYRNGLTDIRVSTGDDFSHFVSENTVRRASWQYRTLSSLAAYLETRLGKYVSVALVHGSFGSGDFIDGWSDADVIIVLAADACESDRALRQVKTVLQRAGFLIKKIDPLSHHECIVLTSFDLSYYPPLLFPPTLLKYGKRFFGATELAVSVRDDRREREKKIVEFCDRAAERARRGSSYRPTIYQWKEDLAHMMIAPSLFLQMRGHYVYKKDSFVCARREFPELDWSVLDRATEIMRAWKGYNIMRFVPDTILLHAPAVLVDFVVRVYRRFVWNRQPRESVETIQTLTSDFARFTQAGLALFHIS